MLRLLLGALLLAAPAAEAEPLSGPVDAEVLRVLDGDTIEVAARIWLDQRVVVGVRLRGVDAPELRGACATERDLARRARDAVEAMLGARVELSEIDRDKYAGRVVARVRAAGEDVGARLVARGLARPYDGGRRGGWCEGPS